MRLIKQNILGIVMQYYRNTGIFIFILVSSLVGPMELNELFELDEWNQYGIN